MTRLHCKKVRSSPGMLRSYSGSSTQACQSSEMIYLHCKQVGSMLGMLRCFSGSSLSRRASTSGQCAARRRASDPALSFASSWAPRLHASEGVRAGFVCHICV